MNKKKVSYKAENFDILQYLFGDFNDHMLHCFIKFDTHVDEACLKNAVKFSAIFLPMIKCGFCEKTVSPRWVDAGYTPDDIVHIIQADDENDVDEKSKQSLYKAVDTEKGPQLKIDIIRAAGHDTMCIVINHMLCDAVGFKEYLYLLCTMYSHLQNEPYYQPFYDLKQRSSKQLFRSFSISERRGILKEKYSLSSQNGSLKFPLEGDRNNPFISLLSLSPECFLKIKEYTKENDVTVNDFVLTAFIRTLNTVLEKYPEFVPCAVDLRKYLRGKKSEGICNLTSNLFCEIGSEIGETFKETLGKVNTSMNTQKSSLACLNGALLLRIISVLPFAVRSKTIKKNFFNPPIAFTNIGIIDKKSLSFGDVVPVDAFITGSIKYTPYFQLAISTFDDKITFTINLYGTQNDKEKVDDFLNKLNDEVMNALK